MTAKEFLQQIRKLDLLIQNKQLEIDNIKNKMTGCGAISYDLKEGQSGTPNTESPQEKYYPILEKYRSELETDIIRYMRTKHKVMDVIDTLTSADEINLLYMRYFKYMKWEKIALEMNISYPHIHRIHASALRSVDKIIKDDTK